MINHLITIPKKRSE